MSSGYRFSNDEKLLLEAVFTYNQRPDRATLQDLANKLAVSIIKVRKWITRNRFKLKQKKIQARRLPRK